MTERDLYAAVDLGSNSFHMVVARREHGELRVIDRIREMVRIAGGLDAEGRLDRETHDRAVGCLARFGQRLAEIPNRHIRAVGTQTFRRLRSPRPFLVVAETALGCPIDIISGREEARLVWLGARLGAATQEPARVVIDIGGGSTEIVAGRSRDPELTESLQYGCVSVTRQAFPDGRITERAWIRMREEIAEELLAVQADLRAVGWQRAIGTSGTIRAVQSICAARDAETPRPITPDDLADLRRRVLEAGRIETVELPGLSSRRQPVIAGGLLILEACMDGFGIERLDVSPYALREGVLVDLVGRLEHRDPRETTVTAMAERFGVDRAQADRVRDFALAGFEQVAEAHGLRQAHRDLLDWACRLHEIGLGIAHSHYQLHSAYVVQHADMAGFSRQEQELMAFLLRYQRRRIPSDAPGALPERLRDAARVMLALIRLSVALCRARSDSDLPDFALESDGRRLVLRLPEGWAGRHPLSSRSLALQRTQLDRIGLRLKIGRLTAPLPGTGPTA